MLQSKLNSLILRSSSTAFLFGWWGEGREAPSRHRKNRYNEASVRLLPSEIEEDEHLAIRWQWWSCGREKKRHISGETSPVESSWLVQTAAPAHGFLSLACECVSSSFQLRTEPYRRSFHVRPAVVDRGNSWIIRVVYIANTTEDLVRRRPVSASGWPAAGRLPQCRPGSDMSFDCGRAWTRRRITFGTNKGASPALERLRLEKKNTAQKTQERQPSGLVLKGGAQPSF